MKRGDDETEEEWESRTLSLLLSQVGPVVVAIMLDVASAYEPKRPLGAQIRPVIHQAAAYVFNKRNDSQHDAAKIWKPSTATGCVFVSLSSLLCSCHRRSP